MMLPDFRDLELYRLPDVKSYKKHVVMAPYTWFRAGGATTVFDLKTKDLSHSFQNLKRYQSR